MNVITFDEKNLKKIHEILFEMMCEFDRICRKHSIKYVICGGTLLGAVRHKGFIPWDDDVDIRMDRKEYNRLCAVCQSELDSDKYFFQTYKTDKGYPWFYAKLRHNYSQYVRQGQEHLNMNDGIFLDIFVSDGIPNKRVERTIVLKCCYVLKKCLYAVVGYRHEKNRLKQLGYFLLRLIPRRVVYALFECIAKKYSDRNKYEFVTDYSFSSVSKDESFPRKWLLNCTEEDFNQKRFMAPMDSDMWLKRTYGNYMELPPPEQRKGTCSIIAFRIADENIQSGCIRR